MTTPLTSVRDGISNIKSRIIPSMIERRPLAPVPRSNALREIALIAFRSKVRPTPSSSNIFWYCFTSAFLGSSRMRSRACSSSSSKCTVTGSRPTNSGINPYRCRSSGSTQRMMLSSSVFSSSSPVKPICLFPRRASTIFSSPSNAPPQIKRMFRVFT